MWRIVGRAALAGGAVLLLAACAADPHSVLPEFMKAQASMTAFLRPILSPSAETHCADPHSHDAGGNHPHHVGGLHSKLFGYGPVR